MKNLAQCRDATLLRPETKAKAALFYANASGLMASGLAPELPGRLPGAHRPSV